MGHFFWDTLYIDKGSEEENHDEEILEVGEGDTEETPLTGFNLEEKKDGGSSVEEKSKKEKAFVGKDEEPGYL